jgi:hypothetical protein
MDTIENYMRAIGMCVGNVENQGEWRFRIKLANPKQLVEMGNRRRRLFM